MKDKFLYDFHGWASKPDVRCSDGVTIEQGAFSNCDGAIVPIVWNHQHNSPDNILGKALLVQRDGGIYVYGSFNDTPMGQNCKTLVAHGDIDALSIFANNIKRHGDNIVHGIIREVSLVIAGANPEAKIQEVIAHGSDTISGIVAITPTDIEIQHGDVPMPNYISHASETDGDNVGEGEAANNSSENDGKTFGEIISTMSDKQRDAMYKLIMAALETDIDEVTETEKEEENETMKQNAFENANEIKNDTLTHAQQLVIISDAKRFGSMKESVLQHSEEYGINQIDYLVPEPKAQTNVPDFIKRDTGWVTDVMSAVHRTPFSRIKSLFADITEDEARAKGYLKGKLKKEEVFGLLKRTTTPTTVYKKQKMDRDDVIDITDFDVIAWLKREMRLMLDEEIARAVLLGDGRLASSDDKINEQCIRPVWKDEELFTIKSLVTVSGTATADDKAKAFIRAAIKSRKDYRGSGNPTLYTTEDFLTDMLLLTDATGRDLYESVDKLAKKLRVNKIVTVPVMEGVTDTDGSTLMGIIVNMNDYTIGADKGGAINMFDDFDIDYNQQKYLIETRCSGSLTKPYSAIAITLKVSG